RSSRQSVAPHAGAAPPRSRQVSSDPLTGPPAIDPPSHVRENGAVFHAMTAGPLVHVAGLRKLYGAHRVLDDVSLDVAGAEAVALLGANGAGKTTLLRILATLARPTRGAARVAGFDCCREPERVRERVGVVAHGLWVYDDLTALENLRFWATLAGLPARPQELQDALAAVELERAAHARVRTFSAGMKRRLSLARLVLAGPSVLLLDEPFAGLDP